MLGVDVVSEGATQILVGLSALIDAHEVDAVRLGEAQHAVYEATGEWFESHGEGRWPPLADSTLTRKRAKGQPDDPLVATGAMKESAVSAHGPHSFEVHTADGIAFGVDWLHGGWQIPVVQHYGTETAGMHHDVRIPARPVWPAHDSEIYHHMRERLRVIMFGRVIS